MPYALYIDESGDFREGEEQGLAQNSLAAGWIAKNDCDHEELRKTLGRWRDEIELKEPDLHLELFHATEWRKTQHGRHLLSSIFDLVQTQDPYALLVVQNRTGSTAKEADSAYLDMIVDLITNALFMLLDGRVRDGFPLKVYVAERKGLTEGIINQLVRYRFRSLLADSVHRGNVRSYHPFEIQVRGLNSKWTFLDHPQSRSRSKYGLMPELILADFICNGFFQQTDIRKKPDALLEPTRWHSTIFVKDPFWRDLNFFKSQGRWVDVILESESQAGVTWSGRHQELLHEFQELREEASKRTLSQGVNLRVLVRAVDEIIRFHRDWEHAGRIVLRVEEGISAVPSHLRPWVEWNLLQYRLMLANHTGDNHAAAGHFDRFQSLFQREDFQRTEFFGSIPDACNRRAISITDNYDFGKAEEILLESIAMEKQFLEMEFLVQGRPVKAKYSDTLGKLLSTLGQLRTKQACRAPALAEDALLLFDEAEKHLQQSQDPPRQRNYRVEAYLATRNPAHSGRVYDLLTGGEPISPQDLLAKVRPDSFDTIYWLRWMLMPENCTARPYIEHCVRKEPERFLTLSAQRYPQMSILYYFGQIAWHIDTKDVAIQAWRAAAQVGRSYDRVSVLQTLALRPLCELSMKDPDETAAKEDITRILNDVDSQGVMKPEYFKQYLASISSGGIDDNLIRKLRDDIPYS